jgi:hypothetical protein
LPSAGITTNPTATAIKPEDKAGQDKTSCNTLDSKEDSNTELVHVNTSADLVHLYQYYSPELNFAEVPYY